MAAPQVERWRGLVAAYWPASQVDNALAVMAGESSGDPGARNDRAAGTGVKVGGVWVVRPENDPGEHSYGLFQINTNAHGGDFAKWSDPETNIAYAARLYANAGWSPWVYTAGHLGLPTGANTAPVPIPVPGIGSAPNLGQTPNAPTPTVVTTGPQPTFPDVPGTLGGIASGVKAVGDTLVQIPASIAAASTAWLSSVAAALGWLGQENIWLRIGLALLGGVLIVVGLILFGVSFLPAGTPLPVPVPV